jgi:hypothetical protein
MNRREARRRELGTNAVASQLNRIAVGRGALVRLPRTVEQAAAAAGERGEKEVAVLTAAPRSAHVGLAEADDQAIRVVAGCSRLGQVEIGRAKPNGTLGPGTVLPPPAVPTNGSTRARRLAPSVFSGPPPQPEARRAAMAIALGRAVAQERAEGIGEIAGLTREPGSGTLPSDPRRVGPRGFPDRVRRVARTRAGSACACDALATWPRLVRRPGASVS